MTLISGMVNRGSAEITSWLAGQRLIVFNDREFHLLDDSILCSRSETSHLRIGLNLRSKQENWARLLSTEFEEKVAADDSDTRQQSNLISNVFDGKP